MHGHLWCLQACTYQQAQGELSMINGLLVYNSHIVVPESQRKYILQKLHESHQGLTKCRQNAQNAVRWPGLSRDLTELTDSCRACREHRPSQKKQPTILQERPWRKLGADLCACQGKDYLVVADYYSRWLWRFYSLGRERQVSTDIPHS